MARASRVVRAAKRWLAEEAHFEGDTRLELLGQAPAIVRRLIARVERLERTVRLEFGGVARRPPTVPSLTVEVSLPERDKP